jgi:hypothetical protein
MLYTVCNIITAQFYLSLNEMQINPPVIYTLPKVE